MSKNTKTVDLVCTSAFMAGGKMITPKEVVRGVPESDAMSLVRRGKAKIVTAAPVEADAEIPALQELSVDELKNTAEEYQIEGAAKMKKAELIKAIEAAEAEGDE